jgi:hypothetical protein
MTAPLETLPDAVTDQEQGGVRIAALVAAHLYAGFALLQVAVALGAPFGEVVWGGVHDAVLPIGLRLASAAAAALLMWMLTVVLARAEIVRVRPVKPRHLARFTWAIAGCMVLNTLGNAASQNVVEQGVFAPVTAILAALTVVVARRGRGGDRSSRPPWSPRAAGDRHVQTQTRGRVAQTPSPDTRTQAVSATRVAAARCTASSPRSASVWARSPASLTRDRSTST